MQLETSSVRSVLFIILSRVDKFHENAPVERTSNPPGSRAA